MFSCVFAERRYNKDIKSFIPFLYELKGSIFMTKLKSLFSIKTIKSKLIIYNLIIVISIAMFVSVFNFISYRKNTIKTAINNSMYHTKNISDRLQIAYEEMLNIVLNCTERKSLFLSINNQNMQTSGGKQLALYGTQVLKDYCAVSGYSEYIAKITLYSKKGVLIQSGFIPGSFSDVSSIRNSDWFRKEIKKNASSYQLSLIDSPFSESHKTKLLPILRTLEYDVSNNNNGWVLLCISSKLYSKTLQQYNDDSAMYCITGEGDVIASVNTNDVNGTSIIKTLLNKQKKQGYMQVNIDGIDSIVTYYRQSRSGILIYEIIPLKDLSNNHTVIIQTIILLFISCFIIGLLLSVLISKKINKPIARLLYSIKKISGGDFTHNSKIEGNDEIGTIGKCVNQMSSQIYTLLDTRVEIEKEKKDLEIKMLQAQINPHFLYNTLDSIRWIAMIQKNSGIVQVVTSLSSLLKNMAKGFNEKVTLKKELEFLNDYVIIEKIRYVELFDLDIQVSDPVLYNAKIVKLTLQPIVENAIFSGIEPSGHTGIIKISAYTNNNTLYISVLDNGVGISPENIDTLLSETERVKSSTMSGIGLPNVDRRLKLVYGEDYGIKIDSELGKYTNITVSLPLELD